MQDGPNLRFKGAGYGVASPVHHRSCACGSGSLPPRYKYLKNGFQLEFPSNSRSFQISQIYCYLDLLQHSNMLHLFAFSFLFLPLLVNCAPASASNEARAAAPSVVTDYGTWVGTSSNNIDQFLGIPFVRNL
jgi:hypothetical protein